MKAKILVVVTIIFMLSSCGIKALVDDLTEEEEELFEGVLIEESFTVNLGVNQTYSYPTGITGDEDVANILVNANHYITSDIIRDASTNYEAVYTYTPEIDYIGEDTVELELLTGVKTDTTAVDIRRVNIVFNIADNVEVIEEVIEKEFDLRVNESFSYPTGITGDEDGARIIKEADNFVTSRIVRNADTNFEAVYNYTPTIDYVGVDTVNLELTTGAQGSSAPTKIQEVKLLFTIKE